MTDNKIIWCDNPNYPHPLHSVLYTLMSSISEDWYAATWMHGLDKTLYDHMKAHPDDLNSKMLKAVSDQIGGWIAWCTDPQSDDSGPVFILWSIYLPDGS